MGKDFNNFTYGVGLEVNASSFKQVKDSLKVNLDNLSKMVKSYGKVLKIDPDADLSKLFDQVKEIQSIVNGIGGSSNSFSGFVDKGVLTRIANLETGLEGIASTSKTVQTNLAGLKSIIDSITGSLKDAGQAKFPATFDNLFPKDQSANIKKAEEDLNGVITLLNKVKTSKRSIAAANDKGLKKGVGIEEVKTWLSEFAALKKELTSSKSLDLDTLQEKVLKISNLSSKLTAAQNTFTDKQFDASGLTAQINQFNNSSKFVTSKIDELIANISKKREELQTQLDGLRADQSKLTSNLQAGASTGKSLGLQSDVSAQVKILPKTNDAEWVKKINDTITNIEPNLKPVSLRPTFSKGKNIDKEVEGNLAQINHAVNVDLKVNDNIVEFDKKIQGIDASIRNAKQQLEKSGTFKIRFDYEEGGKFKDAAYKIINQFKKIEATFHIKNGKKFIQDVTGLRTKATKELKDIPANVVVSNSDSALSNLDIFRSEIEKKIGNIGVNLNIQNMPEVFAQATLMRDAIEKAYNDNPVGLGIGSSATVNNVENTSKSIEEISEAAKLAKIELEKCNNVLKSLTENGFNAPEFLQLGDITPDGKKAKGSTKKLEELLNKYKALQSKLPEDVGSRWQELYPEANGDITVARKIAKEVSIELKQVESELGLYLQKQIAYAQSRYEQAQKTLQIENEIYSARKEQKTVDARNVDYNQTNKQISMSAEEAAKKVRSLNGTLTQQKKVLADLDANGFKSSSFAKLGEWNKESGSFKKNTQYIQDQINKYNELYNARVKSGGTKAVGEEASIRGKLSAILREQKKHISEIISHNQEELESAKQIVNVYKEKNNSSKVSQKISGDAASTKEIDQLVAKLNQAKSALKLLKSKKIEALSSTGLGDVKNRLASSGSGRSFDDLINEYNTLIAKRNELEKSGVDMMSSEYIGYAKQFQGVEQQLNVIYNDQLKYTKDRIKDYDEQISKARQLLQLEQQRKNDSSEKLDENKGAYSQHSSIVKLDGSTLDSLAKDNTLKSIDGKLSNILAKLGSGINIIGANNSTSTDGNGPSVQANEKIASSAENATNEQKELNDELNITGQNVERLSSAVQIVNARTGELKKEVNTYNTPDKVSGQIDTYGWVSHGKDEPETFEHVSTVYKTNMEAFNKLRNDFVNSFAKQKQIEEQIATANGPTSKLQAELEIQKEITNNLEAQLNTHKALYTQEVKQMAIAEATKKARQEIARSAGAESDRDAKKQNSDLQKIIDGAQKNYDNMQYAVNNSKVPMADQAIAKFKEYEQLLTILKSKQQEINADKSLLNDESYSENFNSLLQKMQKVQTEFTTLQKSSDSFLSKIRSLNDIKSLGDTFDPANLEQMHNEMQNFANQVGVGSAKLIEFNDAERTATFEIKNGKGQVQQLTVAYDAATNSLGRYISKTKTSLSDTQKFFNSLKHSFQNVARYVASFGSVYKIFAIIKQGVSYVREIDSALTELKKVTDETDASYDSFLKNMANTGSVIGATVKDLTTMAADWARLGYSMQEAGKLAESTAILLNVSEFQDATAASEALISTMQAFQYTADESGHVVDILNEVGNNYAVSSDGIATALQDSASALMEGGNNLEQAVALVAAANRVVQDPNSVGSALRTISLRLRGTSVEVLEQMGEETDSVVESTSKLQSKIQALSGVNILTDAGDYKDTYTILKEIGKVWEDMSDIDQAALLELMAGKNRANTLSAILSNMTDLEGAYESALNAEGSAMKENETYLDSIQGRIDLFNNSVQTMWMNFIDDDAVKWIVDLGSGLIKLIDNVGLLKTAFAGLLIYLNMSKKSGLDFASMFGIHDVDDGWFAKIKNQAAEATDESNTLLSVLKQINTIPLQQVGTDIEMGQKIDILNQKFNEGQESFVKYVSGLDDTDIALKAYIASVDDGSYSLVGFQNFIKQHNEGVKQSGITAKAAAIGHSLLNAAISMGISLLVSWAVSAVTRAINANEELAKSAEEAISKYQDAQTTLNKQKKTINELSDSYERLSKGVNLDTNENINLTTSSYQEYLNICNDIADMYPHLVTGFDAQGNAILSLKGNVDELVQAYKEAAQLSRQEMIASGGNVFTTFKNEYDKLGTGFDETVGHKQKLALAKKMQELINSGTDKEINDFFKDFEGDGTAAIDGNIYTKATLDSVLKSMGIELDIAGRAPWKDFWTGSTDIDEFKSYSAKILSFIKSTTTEMNTSTSKVKSLMDAYLGEDLDYVKLGADARSAIDQVVSNLDIGFIDSFESADQLYSWIKTNIVDAFNDQEVVDAVDSLKKLMLEFNQGDITYSDYVKQLEEYMSKLKGKISEEAIIQIKFGIGIGETNITTDIERIFDMLERKSENDLDHKADYLYLINGLSVEDIQIAGQLEVPDSVFYTWDELLVKIKEAKIAATKDFTTDNFSDYAESISDISSTIGAYQEALEKLESGTFTLTDFMELIKEFPDLADGVDASTNSFNGLSQNLKKAIRNSPNKLVDELEELRDRLKEAGKSTTNIDQLITSIKNLPIDTVKSLSDEYVTLADQINKAKIAQNELQEAMSENPNEGYETRGEALDAMKKLMSEGKIGSESELWNIAEKYGFTYDSAQTINENADALARFIAAREEWYKTDDDGNYTFDGTKNFLNDVESVVANNARLQELGVKWEYDDSTGSLNFDFNNSDWDEVVKILGESKELAGLTSEEFYDLLMQVGQFFDINWQDANDLIYFMDQINNGTKSAAENFDTTKYAVTSFLESEGFSADALELKVDDEKFKALPEEVQEVLRKYNEIKARFEADPLGITWQLEQDAGDNKNGGLTDSSIAAINQLVSTATDKETGVTWLSLDELSAAAKDADMDVDALMKHIKELQDAGKIIDLKVTEEDPLGLQSMQSDAETTIKYIESLGIKMNELNDGITIDVPSFIDVMAKANWSSEQIQAYIAQLNANGYTFTYTTEENKVETLDVNTDAGKTKVDELLATSNELTDTETLTVNIDGTAEGVLAKMQSTLASLTSKPHNIVVNETTNKRTVYSVGFGKADGTAHAKGTAYKNGSWGAQKTETALVGELGPELLVRDGRWTTIGDNGAEFTQVRKGDIIFNHKQTEDLLSKGYITGRGRLRGSAAFASGTAYPGGSGSFAGYEFSGNGGYKKFDVNGNLVDEFGNLIGSASSASDSLDDLVDSIDWIEIRMEEIDEALSKLSAELENTIGYAAKNNKINELIALNQQKYNNATAGADYYNKYIDKYWSKIPKEYQEWAKNGAIAIADFTDKADEKTIDAIQNYRDYVQKASDLTTQAEEVLTEISSLAKQAIDNIASDYDNKHSLNDAKISQLEAYNDLLETDKGFAAEGIYGAIIKENESKMKSLTSQRDVMQAELNKRVEAGEIQVNSQDWYDAVAAIADVDTEIINLKVEVEDLQDSINELHWDKFDLLITQFQAVSDEAENLIDILSTKDAVDEFGNWTDDGVAQLGLLAQQMEVAEMQSKQYEEEIKYLNENWEKLGYTQEEYVDKLEELKSGQYDAIKAYNDTKDAIVDLNKERIDAIKDGIEKEIDAYDELIKKKKEALENEKDLYDFQKSVADQQKDIADIERKLAALSGDNSASARAKRAKLEADLYEAKASLEETYYDRSISDQQDALDKELENFKEGKEKEIEGLEKYLESVELVVADSIAVVQANTDAVLKTITAMSENFGLAISNALTSPWEAGENAIQNYGKKLGVSLDVLSAMLGMTVDQLASKLGMTTEELVGSLNITVAQLATNFGLTSDELAAKLGVTVSDLNGMMGATIQELAANVGITLPVLAEKLGTTTSGLAGKLDMTMSQFAGGVGLTVDQLADKFGLTATDLAKRLGMTYQDLVEPFGVSMSKTVDALKKLETDYSNILSSITGDSQIAINEVDKAMQKYQEAKKSEEKQETTTNQSVQENQKQITVGGKINAGNARIYATSNGTGGGNQYFASDPIYTVLKEEGDYVLVRHHKLSSGYTGWFKKSDIKAYAKGTLGTKKDELAWIDELGEELRLVPNGNGRLSYIQKGTGIVPADLTENLMEWGKLDPQDMLDRNRPAIAPSKSICNTEIKLDYSVGSLVNIEHCDRDTLPDVEKLINKAFDKHMQNLNNSIKRFTR